MAQVEAAFAAAGVAATIDVLPGGEMAAASTRSLARAGPSPGRRHRRRRRRRHDQLRRRARLAGTAACRSACCRSARSTISPRISSIPLELEAAAALIAEGHVRAVDVAELQRPRLRQQFLASASIPSSSPSATRRKSVTASASWRRSARRCSSRSARPPGTGCGVVAGDDAALAAHALRLRRQQPLRHPAALGMRARPRPGRALRLSGQAADLARPRPACRSSSALGLARSGARRRAAARRRMVDARAPGMSAARRARRRDAALAPPLVYRVRAARARACSRRSKCRPGLTERRLRRIAHLSDLHFGRVDPIVCRALQRGAVNEAGPISWSSRATSPSGPAARSSARPAPSSTGCRRRSSWCPAITTCRCGTRSRASPAARAAMNRRIIGRTSRPFYCDDQSRCSASTRPGPSPSRTGASAASRSRRPRRLW